MRPDRLEVEGFTAFRDKAVVDFAGADLFAFVGPTGSGKSSLVDAILFALYGVVPRLGKATVEPVISLGRNEARIRFDFTVGERAYAVARVVRRTKSGGATTAEARLEGGPESIMGADEVTDAVEGLLGLGFDHFTKCVVLPQGQFAAFLQDPAAKRQELLRQLLDLGRYRRMRELAVDRQKAADNRVEVLAQQIADLAFASDEALQSAASKRDRLTELVAEIEKSELEIETVAKAIQEASHKAEKARDQAKSAASITEPSDIATLSGSLAKATMATETARRQEASATKEQGELDAAVAELEDPANLARLAEQWGQLAVEKEAEAKALVAVEKAGSATKDADQQAKGDAARASEAMTALESVRRQHAAHALAAHLEQGEPCPVCQQTVDRLPAGDDAPPELVELEEAAEVARLTVEKSESVLGARNQELAAARSRYEESVKRVAQISDALAGQPDRDQVARMLEERREVDGKIKASREATEAARKQREEAERALARVNGDLEKARLDFDRARDRVAVLKPPPAERENLAADWKALVAWAEATAVELTDSAERLSRSVADQQQRLKQIEEDTLEELRIAGVDHRRGQRWRDALADALAAVKQEVVKLEQAQKKTSELAGQRAIHSETGSVAKMLARHLAANGFEGWLMAEALEALIDGANQRLDDLSGGAFSLEVAKRDFQIVDHRNADERRSVKTLSGGETFLVSLALALALAEQLASMSVHGVARLESMFLDEGFGTLDVETLDTVATVIHELGSDGRTIGLITHVKDLAEQVPTRFEVSKGPGGATVERIDA